MEQNLAADIAALEGMTVPQLRRRYWEVFGEETTSRHKAYLRKRIARGMQANVHGGLSPIAQGRIAELADTRLLHVRLPVGAFERIAAQVGALRPATDAEAGTPVEVGTVLTRRFKGVEHRVEVLADGFRHGDRTYRSLSAVARAITGTSWNGRLFFGLKKGATSQQGNEGAAAARRPKETA